MFGWTVALHTFMVLNVMDILIGRILFIHTHSLILYMDSLFLLLFGFLG